VAALAERATVAELRARLKKIFSGPSPREQEQAREILEVVDRLDREELASFARSLRGGVHTATPVFDGAAEGEIKSFLAEAGFAESGKTALYDGRTGRAFDQEVTVGCSTCSSCTTSSTTRSTPAPSARTAS